MFFKNLIILFIVCIQLGLGQDGEKCSVNDEVCTQVISCDVAVRSIKSEGRHHLARCGFDKTMEMVCCPSTKPSVVPKVVPNGSRLTSRAGGGSSPSVNEDGDKCSVNNGLCTKVINCDVAVRSIKSEGKHELPRCGFDKTMELVCCPSTDPSSVPESEPNGRNDISSRGGGGTRRRAYEECDKIKEQFTAPTKTYIIGGINAEEGEFPHMAALGYEVGDGVYEFVCAGSLISDTYILTAAHCVVNVQGYVPSIARLGTLNISNPEFVNKTDYVIDSITAHPLYKRPKKYHDLALIRLSQPVTMSDQVYPVCINSKRLDPNTELYITGWGKTDVTRSRTSEVLLKGKVSLVSQDTCNRKHRISRALPQGIIDKQICAMDESRNIDACQGDSGGPLQYYSTTDSYINLVGVTSFGKGCATETPGVYTRVNKYLNWIENIVWPS